VGLADSRILLALYGIEAPIEAIDPAREHLAKALALDPDCAEVQTAQGAIWLFFDWDLDAAASAFERALALNPSYTTAYLGYGDLLMMRGESDRGLALIRQAFALSPFDLGLSMNIGDFLIFARRFDEAIRQLGDTLRMDERFVPARLRLAEALALSGRRERAWEEVVRAAATAPAQPRVRETRAFVLAATGRGIDARRELAALDPIRHDPPFGEVLRGIGSVAHAGAGNGLILGNSRFLVRDCGRDGAVRRAAGFVPGRRRNVLGRPGADRDRARGHEDLRLPRKPAEQAHGAPQGTRRHAGLRCARPRRVRLRGSGRIPAAGQRHRRLRGCGKRQQRRAADRRRPGSATQRRAPSRSHHGDFVVATWFTYDVAGCGNSGQYCPVVRGTA
jgi:tetratricopeptide (TPR) repeat protein